MKIIKPSIQFYDKINGDDILKKIEFFGRICYQSEPKGDPEKFVRSIIKRGHTSVIEHASLSFVITTNRGVLAEWTRHRIASYSVESTRYVKYNKSEGDSDMEFIEPFVIENDDGKFTIWEEGCKQSEESYCKMIEAGAKPQEARSVLNNSLRCMIGCTMNMRSLRNFLSLRCDAGAHPDIKILAISMLKYLQRQIPVIFDDIKYDEQFYTDMLNSNRWCQYIITTPANSGSVKLSLRLQHKIDEQKRSVEEDKTHIDIEKISLPTMSAFVVEYNYEDNRWLAQMIKDQKGLIYNHVYYYDNKLRLALTGYNEEDAIKSAKRSLINEGILKENPNRLNERSLGLIKICGKLYVTEKDDNDLYINADKFDTPEVQVCRAVKKLIDYDEITKPLSSVDAVCNILNAASLPKSEGFISQIYCIYHDYVQNSLTLNKVLNNCHSINTPIYSIEMNNMHPYVKMYVEANNPADAYRQFKNYI